MFDGEGTPAGIYLVTLGQPGMRRLCPSNEIGPINLSFTPDGAYIIAEYGLQIFVIETATGVFTQPFYTSNWAIHPDAGPTGHQFIYGRATLGYGDPPDSTGIRIFDLDTRRDSVLRDDGLLLQGGSPKWSPDYSQFAFLQARRSLRLYDPTQSKSRELTHTPDGQTFNSIRWCTHPITGRLGILYTIVNAPFSSHFIDVASGKDELWPLFIREYDIALPHSSRLVVNRQCSTPKFATLFTQESLDSSGTSAVMLTDWKLPK
jgi:WD40 repeat protein